MLHAIRVEDPSAFGCLVHDGDGRISSFLEKPPRDEAPTDEINAGTYLLEPSILDLIPAGRRVSIEVETFPDLLARGGKLYAFTTDDYWLDVGRPQQYVQAHGDVLDGKLALPPAALGRHGSMWLVGGPDVPSNVRPPAYVGSGVTIDESARIGPYAVLGDGCRVGAGAEVSGSILWDGVAVDAWARVTDSILASNVHVGSAQS